MKKPAQHPLAEVPRRRAKFEMTIGNMVESNMRRNNKSKDADKGKYKDETVDTSDLLIESRLAILIGQPLSTVVDISRESWVRITRKLHEHYGP